MRKLVLILIGFIAVVTFIKAIDNKGSKIVDVSSDVSMNIAGNMTDDAEKK
ncbi:MAG: hypothetical protein LBT14_00350 [Treponema sp.]|jgi:hypothetical protein|nr:hypothetical protein [Treponema sp.]